MTDIAASLLEVVALSIRVTMMIYECEFEAGTKGITDSIARSLSRFGNELEVLAERLADEAITSICSARAMRLAGQLNALSLMLISELPVAVLPLFQKVLIPYEERKPYEYRVFKTKYFHLEIEWLRSTSQLLASVLQAGKCCEEYVLVLKQLSSIDC